MDDITASVEQGVGGNGVNVLKKLKKEVEEKGFKLSITEGGQEGNSKVVASCKYLEEKLRDCSREEGVVMAETEKQKVRGEILAHQEKRIFQQNYMTTGVRKLMRSRSRESVERTSRWYCLHREIEIDETGGSGKQ